MSNELTTFTFTTNAVVGDGFVAGTSSFPIRVVTIDGDPWFVAKDVCRACGLSDYNVSAHMTRLDADEKDVIANPELSLSQIKGQKAARFTVVSESGLYKLVLRSDKPQAKPFQDWVTKVVLPAIRKDGAYVMGEEKVVTGEMSEDELVLKALGILQKKVERLGEEKAKLEQTIEQELNLVTIDEFRALSHEYWKPLFKQRVSRLAAKIARAEGFVIEKQPRKLTLDTGEVIDVAVNVYHCRHLEAAKAQLLAD